MRTTLAIALTSLCLTSMCRPACGAATLTITSANASVSICSGCGDTCAAVINVPCLLTCENVTSAINEYAYVSLKYTMIDIDTSATSDAFTLVPGTTVCAISMYRIDFTLDEPTAMYANWNTYWPAADTDFLPFQLPENGVWVGAVPAGAHYIQGTVVVEGGETLSTGLLMRVIPDLQADCDNDGVPDWSEIVAGTQTDVNSNGIPDSCELNPADLNGDGIVGSADVGILLGAWGPCAGCPADLNGDGIVGSADVGILLGAWG